MTTRYPLIMAAAVLATAAFAGKPDMKTEPKLPPAPVARQDNVVDDYHGTKVPDPYRWLEDPDSTETQAWVAGQNARAKAYLAANPFYKKFQTRLKKVWNYERVGTPQKEAGYYYFTRTTGLENQAPLYRSKTLGGKRELVLDPNKLSKDGTVALGEWAVSHDGRYFAYTTEASGSDWNEAYVLELATGKKLPDHLEWLKFTGLAWLHDGSGFFYARYPKPEKGRNFTEANYNHAIYFHKLGTTQAEDKLVYARPDNKELGLTPDVTDDGKFLVTPIWLGTDTKSGIAYAELSKGVPSTTAVRTLVERGESDYNFIGNIGRTFYVLTDNKAPNMRIIAIDIDKPQRENWKEIVPEGADAIDEVGLIGGQLIVGTLHDAAARLTRYAADGRSLGQVPLPGLGAASGLTGKTDDTEFFFDFTSFTEPWSVFRFDLKTDAMETVFRPKVEFKSEDYVTTQVFARSKDGTRVPVFVTHRKDMKLDGSNPTRLYAYGGYRANTTPFFSTSGIAWYENGGAFAVAIIRGGGEYGEKWHRGGSLDNKQNCFNDFYAAAEKLIADGYTSSAHLSAEGASNGGLLMGACITQRPDLFRAIWADVGVHDMLRYHKFTIGWAWKVEYGCSDDPAQFAYLIKYSPLHNVKTGIKYPAVLITTADHDDRVVPAHSYKFAATLQPAQAGEYPILLKVDTKAGHGGGKPTAKIIEERAAALAFLAQELGMK
ncbi:MAG: prolyl oligopeptidase family serine peptidase [Candidatus Sumerlaeaceae bacterium]|nr:prolyl oligopeptidase family serine peptidase [Candidatus Sumerlaeaceae bacterium]